MKKKVILCMMMFAVLSAGAQLKLKAPDVKWEESYSFDQCNAFNIEAYAKGNELMRTMNYKTYYRSDGENFVVKYVADRKGNGMETVIDKKNEVAIQIMGTGGVAKPYYNVGGFVMEMTSEDAGGGRTLMTTVALKNAEKYTIDLKGAEMNIAINKVNYFTF